METVSINRKFAEDLHLVVQKSWSVYLDSRVRNLALETCSLDTAGLKHKIEVEPMS